MASTSLPWNNRITGYGEVPPGTLTANPANFRTHPKNQTDALAGVLSEVGVVQNVIVNKKTGFIVDGHLRVALAVRDKQPTVPVTFVDLTPTEEALILATLDPIAALAGADRDQLDALLREVQTSDAAVMQLLADLAEANGVVPEFDAMEHWAGMPEFEQEDQTADSHAIVNFRNASDRAQFEQKIDTHIPLNTNSIWYPQMERANNRGIGYTDES